MFTLLFSAISKKNTSIQPTLASVFSNICKALLCILWVLLSLSTHATETTTQTEQTTEAEPASTEQIEAVTITIDKIANLTSPILHKFSAKVEASQQATVSAEASGIVLAINIELGKAVNKGDTLLTLDCESLRYDKSINAAQKKAQLASVKLAKKQVNRFTKLKTKGAATQAQIDEFSASAESANAQLGVFDANIRKLDFLLKKCSLTAPFDGIVTDKSISLGEFASPGMPLLTLTSIRSNEVVANLRSDLINQLKANIGNAQFHFDGQHFPVTIKTVIPSINSLANTQEVRMISSEPERLLNQANGQLTWRAGLSLPSRYLALRDGTLGIYIYQTDNTESPLTFFPIPDADEGRSIRIDQLLPAETQIVTAGLAKINDDNMPPIKIVIAN